VQECCSADQPDGVRRHQEEEDDASSRGTNDTPQKRDCRPSPVQMNPKMASVSEAYLSRTCARKYQNGESFWDSRTLTLVVCASVYLSQRIDDHGYLYHSQGR